MKNTNFLSYLVARIFFFLLLFSYSLNPLYAARETLSIETYYPAPYGSFFEIKSVGKNEFSTDSAGVAIGKLWNVGDDKLEVQGNIDVTGNVMLIGTVDGQ